MTHYEILPDPKTNITYVRTYLKQILLDHCFGGDPMIINFKADHLRFIYEYYDINIFDGVMSEMLRQKHRMIKFGTDLRSVHTAGKHTYKSNIHTIVISKPLICKLFSNGEKQIGSNGLAITDRLEGLINVMEHEIVHLYCSLKGYTRKIKKGKGKMYYSPHGKLFQELVFRFFGHTDYRHNFNNGDMSEQITKNDCRVGMCVYFDGKNGKRFHGKIMKVNPRRGKVKTDKGAIYSVPYSMLRNVL